ncbi:hypothetical protein N7462_005640 [Penicillium macrosclerotiorum]|uniref:uncharacterized protein n=1 Tax=Penicillium macrosclerotiorum TaxID=303699 RepID=UPI00254915BA|nr:uncharacterized protein N7462_005640 [Penicillium macrosclerotiorum]KAJ5682475.1 hypothetical protein N7462_005640 [Penicillium macrosclerotiorum]
MGKTFDKIHACCVGNLAYKDRIPQWIRANGGKFSVEVDNTVTHLITTRKAYKDKEKLVQDAKNVGTIKIVSYDWLSESLLSKNRRPKPVGPYLLESLIKGNKKAKADNNGSGASRAQIPKKKIHRDPQTGEAWDATLIRLGQLPRSREKYRLAIFEFPTTPPTYSTFAKYSRVGTSRVEQLAPPKSNSTVAINSFKAFFTLQTGKEWENKEDGNLPGPRLDPEGQPSPVPQNWYSFESRTNIFTNYLMNFSPSSTSNVPIESPSKLQDV